MSENVIAHSTAATTSAAPAARPRAFDTIMYGGLAVGVLDALDAIIFFGMQGVSPVRIFQSIASGLLGPDAYRGGLKTALLGVPLHFMIAFAVAAVYYAASLRWTFLLRRAIVGGLLYGVAVYFVMNYLVLPLSAAPKFNTSMSSFLDGVIGHAVLVGLPAALAAQRSSKSARGTGIGPRTRPDSGRKF